MTKTTGTALALFLLAATKPGEAQTSTDCPNVGSGWTTLTLDATINYVAHHKIEPSNTLNLRLSATTTGWLGFGLAEPTVGHMKGSDMVTVSVDQGTVTVHDRYAGFAATTYTAPSYTNGYTGLTALVDTHNDWTIVSGSVQGGTTEVWLTRPLSTGDSQDRAIGSGSTRITWAWGNGASVSYHGSNRGAATTTFVGSSASSALPSYDGVWTRTIKNYAVPGSQITTYACQALSFPTDQDRHIVAFRPINVTQYNHHAILHICQNNAYFAMHDPPQLCSYHAQNNPTTSGSSPLGDNSAGCSGLAWSWAVGMGDFILPDAAGFRVGSSSGSISHVILEIHYDNPGLTQGVTDSMGFEAYYVNTPRANDAGLLVVGDPLVQLGRTMSAPPSYEIGALPKQTEYIHRQATCPGECTASFAQTITVFAAFHHMHYYGHKFITEKYDSSGNNLGVMGGRIDFWDNGFQQAQTKYSYTVAPGESLQTHCYYNTASYSYASSVAFSTPTSAEMCMDFLMYYPKQVRGGVPFAFCGLAENSGNGYTLCGALSQANTAFVLDYPNLATSIGRQVDRGNASFVDPLSFGAVNSASVAPSPTPTCTPAPPASPPASPPSPPSGSDSQDMTGAIVGGIAGASGSLFGLFGFLMWRQQKKKQAGGDSPPAKAVV